MFASGLTIKAAQTGKDRWVTVCCWANQSQRQVWSRGPLEGTLASEARRLGRLDCGPVREIRWGCWRRASGVRVKEAPGTHEQMGILRS